MAVVGRVLGSHGVYGEVRAEVLTELPHRFDPGEMLFLQEESFRIQSSSRSSGHTVILKLEGIDGPAAAKTLTGQELLAQPEESPDLPEGEYFHYQLIGMQVITEAGEDLGNIMEIIITGSNDVYVVSGPSGEVLLPAISQVILGGRHRKANYAGPPYGGTSLTSFHRWLPSLFFPLNNPQLSWHAPESNRDAPYQSRFSLLPTSKLADIAREFPFMKQSS